MRWNARSQSPHSAPASARHSLAWRLLKAKPAQRRQIQHDPAAHSHELDVLHKRAEGLPDPVLSRTAADNLSEIKTRKRRRIIAGPIKREEFTGLAFSGFRRVDLCRSPGASGRLLSGLSLKNRGPPFRAAGAAGSKHYLPEKRICPAHCRRPADRQPGFQPSRRLHPVAALLTQLPRPADRQRPIQLPTKR